MTQIRKRLAFLLVILSVATVLFLGSWSNPKSTVPNSIITEQQRILQPSPTYSPTYSPNAAIPSFLWKQIGNDIDGEAAGDGSGWSLALSLDGKTVAVGAPYNGLDGYKSGQVRIFQWTESTSAWTQMGADIDGEAPYGQNGSSVSLSSDGKIVAIGAINGNDIGNGYSSGHVRIFQWTESTSAWTQMGANIDGEAAGDWTGYSVPLSSDGKTVAVGAPWNDGNGVDSGHVRIFQWTKSTSTWTQMGADIDGEAAGDLLSRHSVSLSSDGKTVAVGGPVNDGNGVSSGHVRIFQWTESTSAWTQMGANIDGEAAGDFSGFSVSLSSDGKTVAVGAPGNGGNGVASGRIRIFQWTESTSAWTQMGADIDGEAAGDRSGFSVSLSSDGKTVAVGADRNDGNGDGSGHVRIFQWTESTSAWTQMGADIDGEAAGDISGFSVSLSSDGKTVAVGSPSNDGNGGGSGHVRIFHWIDE
jgi:hypothetical protein